MLTLTEAERITFLNNAPKNELGYSEISVMIYRTTLHYTE
jgi:hypothetical protein